ncbi:neuronal calcium sensor 1-like [Centruroides sculpturatus]|uniref:neuronal calcium sensor 1-like n=1 Tax=Centruroides sculpturatus TaxID=218467 RepID=UPI000C6DC202|nr:neuronal calcium sensor 1-like [Centruroides sculpturatus]
MGENQTKHAVNFDILAKQTHFHKKLLLQWYDDFMTLCPSGGMTKAKFQLTFSEFFPTEDSFQLLDHIFNVFSESKNGLINFLDFVRIVRITSNGTPEEKLDCTGI